MKKQKIYLNLTLLLIFSLAFNALAFFKSSQIAYADTFFVASLQDISLNYENDTSNLNYLSLKNENSFLFTNTTSNQLEVWDENTKINIGPFGDDTQNFAGPTLLKHLPNGNLFVYDDVLDRLKLLDNNLEFVANYNIVYNDDTVVDRIGKISSLTTDLKNNLYAIDYENNYVLLINPLKFNISLLFDETSLGLTLTEQSKIAVSPNGEYLFIANTDNQTNLYYLQDLNNLQQVDIASYGITQVNEIAIDCANNLFLLEKNTTTSVIHKLNRNSYSYNSYLWVENNELNNVTNFQINVETGSMFAINTSTNTLQQIILSNQTENFTANITTFIHPVDYKEAEALTTPTLIAKTLNEETNLLQTPYNITPILTLNKDALVIVLESSVPDNTDFSYVLYVSDTSKQNITGYILNENLEILQSDTTSTPEIIILNNSTTVYKYPTTLKSDENEVVFIGQANKNETFEVLNEANSIMDANNQSFYAINYNNSVGYIRKIDAISNALPSIEPTLFTNAEIIITDNSTSVTVYYNPQSLTTIPYTLSKGTRIYIASYDKQNEYTQITFLNENLEEITGYIQTKYIKVYGDYNNLLQAFILSLVSFVLIVILLVFKASKKQTQQ